MNNHTFTADGTLPDLFTTEGKYSEICLGKDGQTFPATSVKIVKRAQDGGNLLLREFTSAPTNRSVQLTTSPNSAIDIEVTGTSGDFYVELNNITE